jgi:hypothetical protein
MKLQVPSFKNKQSNPTGAVSFFWHDAPKSMKKDKMQSSFTQDHKAHFPVAVLGKIFGYQLITHLLWPPASSDLKLCNYSLWERTNVKNPH